MRDQYVHDCLLRETSPLVVQVPDFVDGAALEDVQEEEGEMGHDKEGNEAVEDALEFVELGQAQEEQAYGYLARCERDEELGRV